MALFASLADASWWLLGFAAWGLQGGAFTVEVECNTTHNSFCFPGWWE